MNYKLFLLILCSVGLSALAQIFLKTGMATSGVQAAVATGGVGMARVVVSNGYVLLGLTLYGIGALTWLLVLARIDVSVAYPFVGLGFIVTLALAWLVLHEPIGLTRLVGTLLVVAGVVLVARS